MRAKRTYRVALLAVDASKDLQHRAVGDVLGEFAAEARAVLRWELAYAGLFTASEQAAGLIDHVATGEEETMESTEQKHRPNILLVHGAMADGSEWTQVIQYLQHKNFNAVASHMPLTSFAEDVRAVKRDLGVLHGPTVVVGHSYGGVVITEAASEATNVAGLVYIAAYAPDAGENMDSILAQYPPSPSAQYIVPVDPKETPPFFIIQRDQYPQLVCQDIEPRKARALAAVQAPTSATSVAGKIEKLPAWRQFPTWYQISSDDRIIEPTVQKMMANRAAPPDHIISIRASHCPNLSHPEKVTKFIEQAAHDSAARSHSA